MAPVRVLVVDDQEPFLRAAAAVVEAVEGFVVVARARNGEESVRAVADHRPDLVLMDVRLPGIDGMEATRRIRRGHPAPAVLLLSTYDRADFGEEPLACGAFGYLSKSDFGPESLLDAWAVARG